MKKTLLSLSFLFATLSLFAQQNTDPILAMQVNLQVIGSDTTAGGLPLLPDSILSGASMKVSLTDTGGISKVYVKFGSADGLGDYLSKTFDYNGTDAAYSRTGYNISISLGQYYGLYKYYSSVRIERIDGSSTDWIPFSR